MAKKATNTVRKARIYFILITALTLINLVSIILYVYFPMLKLLTNNASIILTIIIAFLDASLLLHGFLITINTTILYLQLTCYILNLIEEIDLDSMKFGIILENTANLMKKLKMTFLSLQCFFMILYQTVVLTVEIFNLCDYSTGTFSFPPIVYVTLVGMILLSFLILCIFNWQSYDVKQRLGEIRFYISNFAITEHNFVVIDKQKHTEEYAKRIVISILDEFKGFDANGYFTLGKELLGCIIMFCLSYVVLLIEFSFLDFKEKKQ